ncbi:MAG: amidohydrolase family protein [Actinobacteria bacterium]|nr:amidohydrolase family protein [Actinomycetota bacterium]
MLNRTGTDLINTGVREGFNTREHLRNAERQAQDRGFDKFTIVDVDAHHYEMDHWPAIIKYIEDPVIRHRAEAAIHSSDPARTILHNSPLPQNMAGRILRERYRRGEPTDGDTHHEVSVIRRQMKAIGIDYQVVFPTPMLELGLHPDPLIEIAVSWAYTRWFTEEVLADDPAIKTMVYLPMNDVRASLRTIEQFGGKPGVVGFMITSGRFQAIHSNKYVPVFRALEERGYPLGFHAIHNAKERMFEGMNRFISVHALGFVFYNMVHMTNWVINGLPERYPNLKVIWIESGLAWVPFLMQRLDNEFLMRSSEAPLLQRRPSEYMGEMYYSTQPMETVDLQTLQQTMRMINAETQLMFASDYPHWDFDLPSTVCDLPFLSQEAKLNILGRNAVRLFGKEHFDAEVDLGTAVEGNGRARVSQQ